MPRKRMVLFVEGEGDVRAGYELLKRMLVERNAFDTVVLDRDPWRVGEFAAVSKNGCELWRKRLQAAAKAKDFGGCLLILDGDSHLRFQGQPFCAARAAKCLATAAQEIGGGTVFSVAVVFACMEFESWLIAGAPSLVDRPFSDGRIEIVSTITELPENPETAPRDAKRWLRERMRSGYKPMRDQAELVKLVDLNLVRNKPMRSFRRLESAVNAMIDAFRTGRHTITPAEQQLR